MNLKQNQKNWNNTIVYSLLALLSSVYVYFILLNANWTWGDDYEFLISTAIGKMEWSLHIANRGRFYPFGHFDYNILTLIPGGTNPLAHYILVAISFLFFVLFSYKLYSIVLKEAGRETIFNSWLILISITFLLYYFYRIFFFLVYPERIIIVLLSIFFVLYYKFIKSETTIYGILALIIAVYLSYCKETIFIIFSTIVGLNLFFNYKNISKRQKLFYSALGLNVLIFLLLYYFIAYRTAETFYSRNSTLNDVIQFSFGNLKLLYIALILSCWRLYQFLLKKDRQNLVIDTMLFSGVLYALANIVLKLPMDYYYFPAVMLTLPVITYWIAKFLHPKWICVGLLIVTVYYGRKFPNVIKGVQNQRTETSKDIVNLTNYIQPTTDILWFEHASNKTADQGIRDYQKEILEVYLKFYDKSITKLNIQNIQSIPDSVKAGILLFNSDYNNLQLNDLSSIGFDKLNLPNIYEISIYYKK